MSCSWGPMSSAKSRHSTIHEQYGEDFPPVVLLAYLACPYPRWHRDHHYRQHPLALIEAISHWLIDFCKGEKWVSLHQDQLGHLCFKVLYCVIFYLSAH